MGIISKEFAIVLNNIFGDPFITQKNPISRQNSMQSEKNSCTISSHQKLIFTVMQMQVMTVAVDMNYHIRHGRRDLCAEFQ